MVAPSYSGHPRSLARSLVRWTEGRGAIARSVATPGAAGSDVRPAAQVPSREDRLKDAASLYSSED
jgi:hypothetical protein